MHNKLTPHSDLLKFIMFCFLLKQVITRISSIFKMKLSKENIAQYLYHFELSELVIREPRLSEFIKNRINILEYITVFECMAKIPCIFKIHPDYRLGKHLPPI